MYIRNLSSTLKRHKMTQFKFTELTEKKIHVKQNMKNSNKKDALTHADDKQKQTEHNMCLTPLSANKHNQCK